MGIVTAAYFKYAEWLDANGLRLTKDKKEVDKKYLTAFPLYKSDEDLCLLHCDSYFIKHWRHVWVCVILYKYMPVDTGDNLWWSHGDTNLQASQPGSAPCLLTQYHGCWCPADARSQGICNNDIDLVKPSLLGPAREGLNTLFAPICVLLKYEYKCAARYINRKGLDYAYGKRKYKSTLHK